MSINKTTESEKTDRVCPICGKTIFRLWNYCAMVYNYYCPDGELTTHKKPKQNTLETAKSKVMFCTYRGYKIEFSDTFVIDWAESGMVSYRGTLRKAMETIDQVLADNPVSRSEKPCPFGGY